MAADVVRWRRPIWVPLVDLVGFELAGWFMWMYAAELEDETRVHAYKHISTRRYATRSIAPAPVTLGA
jgi:hypothetical protein